MTTRILPPEDWHRLATTDAEIPWRQLDATRNHVLVTEWQGGIVGCVVLMEALHAEFLWIAPAHRGRAAVARQLRAYVVAAARAWRFPTVLVAALCARMRRILPRLGATPLPGDHFVWTLREDDRCRQR